MENARTVTTQLAKLSIDRSVGLTTYYARHVLQL